MAGCVCGSGGARGTELAPAALSERGRQRMTTGSLPTLLDTTQSQRLSTGGDPNAAARHARPTPPDGGDWLGEAQRYLRSVRRHKWLVLSLTLFATAAGVELSMYALPPNYAARATVWIQVPARQARDEGPIWSGHLPISSGWIDLIRTNIVLEDVARRERSYLTTAAGDAAPLTGTVNAVATRFVATAADLKRDNLTQLTGVLAAQLEQEETKLRSAEGALQRFRVTAVTEYGDGAAPVTSNMRSPQDPVFAGLLEVKVRRGELLRDQAAIKRILAQPPESGLIVDALATIGLVGGSTALR